MITLDRRISKGKVCNSKSRFNTINLLLAGTIAFSSQGCNPFGSFSILESLKSNSNQDKKPSHRYSIDEIGKGAHETILRIDEEMSKDKGLNFVLDYGRYTKERLPPEGVKIVKLRSEYAAFIQKYYLKPVLVYVFNEKARSNAWDYCEFLSAIGDRAKKGDKYDIFLPAERRHNITAISFEANDSELSSVYRNKFWKSSDYAPTGFTAVLLNGEYVKIFPANQSNEAVKLHDLIIQTNQH